MPEAKYTPEQAAALLAALPDQRASLQAIVREAKQAERDAALSEKRKHDARFSKLSFTEVLQVIADTQPVREAKTSSTVYQAYDKIEVTLGGRAYTVNVSLFDTAATQQRAAVAEAVKKATAKA